MKVLYIEDDQHQILLISRILSAQGHHLISTSKPQTALDQALSEKPDLILVDIHLPQMSGFELASQLRQCQDFQHTPIVALTADSAYLPSDYAESGFNDYLVKPFSRKDFMSLVSRFDGHRASS